MSDTDKTKDDLTGRRNMARNVVFTWGGYIVNVIFGFLMPRLIHDQLGQATLGVWDFAWGVVSYFGLVQMGVASSVQRYVAQYRAVGDYDALSRSVSTVGLFLKGAGAAGVLLVMATALWIVPLFRAQLAEATVAAQWAVLFLGLEVAFSIMLTAYGGVLVGCHRWDIHNMIHAGTYAVSGLGMIAVLKSGGGLAAISVVHCAAYTAGDLVRWRLVGKICPELKINYRSATREVFFEQFRYSSKGVIPRIANLISNQALSLLITLHLGPASLAIFARPRSLVTMFATLSAKFGSILIPTASSLHARDDATALQATFRSAVRYTSMFIFPAVITLSVFGDYLMRFWMGGAYVHMSLLAITALGSVASLINEPVWGILNGMNKHGRIALAKLGAAVCAAVALGIGLTFFNWDLNEAAICFVLPQFIVDGFVTPARACQCLGVPLRQYYKEAFLTPILSLLPFTAFLVLCRLNVPNSASVAISFGVLSFVSLLVACWAFLIPAALKQKLTAASLSRLCKSERKQMHAHDAPRIFVVFRNDDPSAAMNLGREREVFGIFERYGVPQTIAVIPRVALDTKDLGGTAERSLEENPEAVAFLREYVARSRSEIALHGYTHRINRFSIPRLKEFAEFKYLPLDEQDTKIRAGLQILQQCFGQRPTTFVPPWNRWDENTVQACVRNGFRVISAGAHVATDARIAALGTNTDVIEFAEAYERAKKARGLVFLSVLLHSATLTGPQQELLVQILERVTRDPECKVATIRELAEKFPVEIEEMNHAGRNIVPLYQVPDTLGARAWPYIALVERFWRSVPVEKLSSQAKKMYFSGEYAGCVAATSAFNSIYACIAWGGRIGATLLGVVIGVLAGRLVNAVGNGVVVGCAAAGLVAGFWFFSSCWIVRKTIARDTFREVITAGIAGTIGSWVGIVVSVL